MWDTGPDGEGVGEVRVEVPASGEQGGGGKEGGGKSGKDSNLAL